MTSGGEALSVRIANDGRTLKDSERAALANLNYLVILEMRILGREGKAEQVKDLAEADHNVPMTMWRDSAATSSGSS